MEYNDYIIIFEVLKLYYMKKNLVFKIGTNMLLVLGTIFFIGLCLDNNQPINHDYDWVGKAFCYTFLFSVILILIGMYNYQEE